VAIIILAGGATAAMKFLEIGPFSKDTTEKDKNLEKKKDSVFVDLEPLIFNIIQGDKISKPIQIQITLETEGQENADFLEQRLTKLKAEFFEDLYSFVPRLLKKQDRLDIVILQKRLKIIGGRLVGTPYIKTVQIEIIKEKNKK